MSSFSISLLCIKICKRPFGTQKRPRGRKNDLFTDFVLLNEFMPKQFCFVSPKFHIFNGSEIHGEKDLHQQTNKQQRTTWAIRIPRQDLSDPQANKTMYIKHSKEHHILFMYLL